MTFNGETTAQRLSIVSYQRKAVMGVLAHRLSHSPEQQHPVADAGSCIGYLLQYASEEHQLRTRVANKARAACGEAVPAVVWRLRHLSGEAVEPTFGLAGSVTVLGRDESCDLLLPLPWISRRHARLQVGAADVLVEDLGSLNGIRVNGQVVRCASLRAGDTLRLGGQRFRLEYIGETQGSMLA